MLGTQQSVLIHAEVSLLKRVIYFTSTTWSNNIELDANGPRKVCYYFYFFHVLGS